MEVGDAGMNGCSSLVMPWTDTLLSSTNPTLDSDSVRARVSFWARRWSARLWTRSSSKRYSTRRGSRSDVEGSEVRLWASSWALELTWKLWTKCSAACVVGSCNSTEQHQTVNQVFCCLHRGQLQQNGTSNCEPSVLLFTLWTAATEWYIKLWTKHSAVCIVDSYTAQYNIKLWTKHSAVCIVDTCNSTVQYQTVNQVFCCLRHGQLQQHGTISNCEPSVLLSASWTAATAQNNIKLWTKCSAVCIVDSRNSMLQHQTVNQVFCCLHHAVCIVDRCNSMVQHQTVNQVFCCLHRGQLQQHGTISNCKPSVLLFASRAAVTVLYVISWSLTQSFFTEKSEVAHFFFFFFEQCNIDTLLCFQIQDPIEVTCIQFLFQGKNKTELRTKVNLH